MFSPSATASRSRFRSSGLAKKTLAATADPIRTIMIATDKSGEIVTHLCAIILPAANASTAASP